MLPRDISYFLSVLNIVILPVWQVIKCLDKQAYVIHYVYTQEASEIGFLRNMN